MSSVRAAGWHRQERVGKVLPQPTRLKIWSTSAVFSSAEVCLGRSSSHSLTASCAVQ